MLGSRAKSLRQKERKLIMKLNKKEKIVSSVRVDSNTLLFRTENSELEVKLHRRIDGFRVRFELSIGGQLWNSDTVTEEDIALWKTVEEASFDIEEAASAIRKVSAKKAAARIFSQEVAS